MFSSVKDIRFLALPTLIVAMVVGIEWHANESLEPEGQSLDWRASGVGPANHASAMEQLDGRIDVASQRINLTEDQWLPLESLARAHIARARLSYDQGDLIVANKFLNEAKALAPPGSGPLLTDAGFAHTTHQLDRAGRALKAIEQWAVILDPEVIKESENLRGDSAFFHGDIEQALQRYQAAEELGGGPTTSYRMARIAKSTGDFEAAIAHLTDAAGDPAHSSPFSNASVALQLGAIELARGEYSTASDWFEIADDQFPDFWLVKAHRAQSRALAGEVDGAITDLRQIALDAPSAEVIDALALLLRAKGRVEESRNWAKQSAGIWDERLKRLPAANYGHAAEHELAFGSRTRALELAKLNMDARPYGEARVLLASALIANRDLNGAIHQLKLAEDSGWRSAPLYALRAQCLDILGDAIEAKIARENALVLNPRIFDPVTSLVWLSHG